jgi:serine/threonine-protein kinase
LLVVSPGLGKYQPIATLGRGGMADVFLAVARGPAQFSKLQVIKRLRSNLAEEPEFLAMFLDEARLAARLNHPHVVQTNEVGSYDGKYFIAMEYLEGQPLHRILQRATGPKELPLAMVLTIVSQALAGLHHAHELRDYSGTPLQVVHRDVSPHNIFVTYDGLTKVVDFGIAKAATRTNETRGGGLKGKVGYMSPEQAKCGDVDRRADIFSMGVILWEILAGTRLWQDSDARILEIIGAAPIARVRTKKPEVAAELDEICARALAVIPGDRYATAAEMRDEIDAYIDASLRRPGEKEIGRVMMELFGDDRAQIRAIVEERLTGLGTGALPAKGFVDDDLDVTESVPRSSAVLADADPAIRGTDAGATLPTLRAAPRGRSRWALVSAALAIAAALGGVVALLTGIGSRSSTSNDSLATRAELPASNVIELRIAVAPHSARIYLDDAPLPENPYSARFPSDGAAHRVRAEAAGYRARTELVIFDRTQSVELTLEPSVEDPSAPAAAEASTKPRAPATAAAQRTATPKRDDSKPPPLDEDPWAR